MEEMTVRVLKSIAVPLIPGIFVCDEGAAVGWIGMIWKGWLPVNKTVLICNPVCLLLLGQLLNIVKEG